MRLMYAFPLLAAVVLTGCPTVPQGPSIMVLPGTGKSFEQFQYDDYNCRQWASQQIGVTAKNAATNTAVTGAVVGTAVGAAAGAALGAAAGNPGAGAAAGSGVGLLGGTAVGAQNAGETQWTLQRRYDIAYTQCMYAKGNQVPMPRGYQPPPASVQMPPHRPAAPPSAAPPPPPPEDW